MYDSRSSHPRGGIHWGRQDRMWDHDHRIPVRPEPGERMMVTEGLLAYLDADEPARLAPTLLRDHGEALRMNDTQHMCANRDCGFADWECALLDGDANDDYDPLDEPLDDPLDDDELGWMRDDLPNMNTFDAFWMPLVSLEQAREHFGRDFLGNGFHIDTHNVIRTTPAWRR